jgi:hypothetical protein
MQCKGSIVQWLNCARAQLCKGTRACHVCAQGIRTKEEMHELDAAGRDRAAVCLKRPRQATWPRRLVMLRHTSIHSVL